MGYYLMPVFLGSVFCFLIGTFAGGVLWGSDNIGPFELTPLIFLNPFTQVVTFFGICLGLRLLPRSNRRQIIASLLISVFAGVIGSYLFLGFITLVYRAGYLIDKQNTLGGPIAGVITGAISGPIGFFLFKPRKREERERCHS